MRMVKMQVAFSAAALSLLTACEGQKGTADTNTKSHGDSAFAAMQQRGQMAMGVDQYASRHKFDITDDGGRIELQSDKGESLEVSQIRTHLKLIQHAFAAGDFSAPAFVHMKNMPGTGTMASKKAVITYTYADLPRGAELRIVTRDSAARQAVADFLNAQRGEHHAGGMGKMKH